MTGGGRLGRQADVEGNWMKIGKTKKMAVEGVRKFFERFMPTRTAKLQEPDTGKVCKPCAVCKATMKAKEEW